MKQRRRCTEPAKRRCTEPAKRRCTEPAKRRCTEPAKRRAGMGAKILLWLYCNLLWIFAKRDLLSFSVFLKLLRLTHLSSAFCDADWAGEVIQKRSTTGFIVYLGLCPVSWQSKKQVDYVNYKLNSIAAMSEISSSSASQVITCKAAVCWGVGEGCKVEEIHVEPPRKGEVRVKMLYASLCHTDIVFSKGYPFPVFPRVLGHEGRASVW
ncbi:hypothetical protein ACLB2K_070763 [Fragaria x ananassa]